MTKTITALTTLAFAAALASGAAAQTSGAMATDKMAADHMSTASSDHMMAKGGAMASDHMKADAMKGDGGMTKKAKKKAKKPMAEGAMASDSAMAKK
jgi:pentapeptide MXKDX repeat protein